MVEKEVIRTRPSKTKIGTPDPTRKCELCDLLADYRVLIKGEETYYCKKHFDDKFTYSRISSKNYTFLKIKR